MFSKERKQVYICARFQKEVREKAVKENKYPLLLFEKKLHVSTFIIIPSLTRNPKSTIATTAK